MEASKARVAIVMATHNDGKTLPEAMASLVSQSIRVDIVLVDDGGGSPLPVEVTRYAHLISLDRNQGLTCALNVGVNYALEHGYEFIGRMDADDVSLEYRVEKQLRFLDLHRDIDGVGAWAEFFDEHSGEPLFVHQGPTTSSGVSQALALNNCVLHPTWLFRSVVFREMQGYNESYPIAQDYEFLVRASHKGFRFANLPEVLLRYRVSRRGISVAKRKRQLWARLRVQWTHLNPRAFLGWYGIAKTAFLFLVPYQLLTNAKMFLHSWAKSE